MIRLLSCVKVKKRIRVNKTGVLEVIRVIINLGRRILSTCVRYEYIMVFKGQSKSDQVVNYHTSERK